MAKRNKKNTSSKLVSKYVAAVGTMPVPDSYDFIANETTEIRPYGQYTTPCLPITGNVYFVDFANTNLGIALRYTELFAECFVKHHNVRAFVRGDVIYIVGNQSMTYVKNALDKVVNRMVEMYLAYHHLMTKQLGRL